MKRILIVSLKAGAGHIKAAEALEKSFKKNLKGVEVRNIDMLEYATILSKKFYTQLYVDVVKYAPKFYDWLYHNIDPSSTDFRLIFDRINVQKFKKLITDFNPDIIVCTHFVAANLATWWEKKYGFGYKVALTVTDYESHSLWIDKGVDFYFVATENVKKELIRFGIEKNRIYITGIPIDDKFNKKYSKSHFRKKIGVVDRFTVSIFSGGFGMGPVATILRNLKSQITKINIFIVAGNNIELKKKLEDIADGNKSIKVFGFVNNIEELMAASDVIVTKPGGLTVSESMAMGIPLIISNPIPGQEEANSKYLLKYKAGWRSDDAEGIVRLIEKAVKSPKALKKLSSNAKKLAQGDAAAKITDQIKKLL